MPEPCCDCTFAPRCASQQLACIDFVEFVVHGVTARTFRVPRREVLDFVFERGRFADLPSHQADSIREILRGGYGDELERWTWSSTTPSPSEVHEFAFWALRNHVRVGPRWIVAAMLLDGVVPVPAVPESTILDWVDRSARNRNLRPHAMPKEQSNV